jgi:small subunit ribosomal protein S18
MTAPAKKRAPGKWKRPRRKVCAFCVDKATSVDWKAVGKLRRYQTDRGKIVARRTSGTCAKHQRLVTEAIQRARHMALMPFVAEA